MLHSRQRSMMSICLRVSTPIKSDGSSRLSAIATTWSDSWETASTTRRPSIRLMSAFPSPAQPRSRAAADMILLAPDLSVLAAGVREGRRTFANILKYVRMGTSSNFGNMLSMALASLALPFFPLLPLQILLNNLLYDLSEIGIPFDEVDPEDVAAPHAWDMAS